VVAPAGCAQDQVQHQQDLGVLGAAAVGLITVGAIASNHDSKPTATQRPSPFGAHSTLCPSNCYSVLFPALVLPDGSHHQGPDADPGNQVEVWHIPVTVPSATADV
jgi:hypothetical protein